jgi:hypothetical protein
MENPGGLFCLNIADLDFYNTSCITSCITLCITSCITLCATLCATSCAITFGPGRRRRPVFGALMQCPGPGPGWRSLSKPPLFRNESDIDFLVVLFILLYLLFYALFDSLIRLNYCHSFFGKWRTQEVCFAQKTVKNKRLKLF